MARELVCNDCGQNLGDPIQSNILNHKAATGHQNITEREALLNDGTLVSNPGTFPDGTKVGEAKPQEPIVAEQEVEALKSTVPSKEEQKEIDRLIADKQAEETKKYNKKRYT